MQRQLSFLQVCNLAHFSLHTLFLMPALPTLLFIVHLLLFRRAQALALADTALGDLATELSRQALQLQQRQRLEPALS